MLNTNTRLIADPEITFYQELETNQNNHRSQDVQVLDTSGEQTVILSPMFNRFSLRPSIETRMREAFKPTISDRSLLQPDKFSDVIEDTRATLVKHAGSKKKRKDVSALGQLIALLKENSKLLSLLNAHINPTIKKRSKTPAINIEVSQKQKDFLQILAHLYVQNDQFKKAIIVYKALRELFPKDGSLAFCLSYLYLKIEQFDTALFYANTYLKKQPTGLGYILKGKILFKLGRSYEAKETISQFYN